MTKYIFVNSFYIVVNGFNKVYSFNMNFEEASKMRDFYNKTIHDEGKFEIHEIDLNSKVVLQGDYALDK